MLYQNCRIFADEYLFPRSGEYKLKLVDRRNPGDKREDIERFTFVVASRKIIEEPRPQPTPPILTPEIECGPSFAGSGCLPPVPVMPGALGPYAAPGPTSPYGAMPYVVPAPMMSAPQMPAPQMSAPQMYGGYTVQIAALRSYSSAVALRDKLLRNGFHNAGISESAKGGQRLFRVRVGPYPHKSLALQEAQRLRSNGFETWVTNL